MNKPSNSILGISTGSTQLGVSVFTDGELVFYTRKSIREERRKDSLRMVRTTVSNLLDDYQIEYVALKKLTNYQQYHSFSKAVSDEIQKHLDCKNIDHIVLDPKMVRRQILDGVNPTCRNSALALSTLYPELARYLPSQKSKKQPYFACLFDAVAIGLLVSKNEKRKLKMSQ